MRKLRLFENRKLKETIQWVQGSYFKIKEVME